MATKVTSLFFSKQNTFHNLKVVHYAYIFRYTGNISATLQNVKRNQRNDLMIARGQLASFVNENCRHPVDTPVAPSVDPDVLCSSMRTLYNPSYYEHQ